MKYIVYLPKILNLLDLVSVLLRFTLAKGYRKVKIMVTVTQQIEEIESEIKKHEERLDTIERMGRLSNMTDEQWSDLKKERKNIEKKLESSRKQLKQLRWENWKSMVVSVVLLGIVYGSYVLFTSSGVELAR